MLSKNSIPLSIPSFLSRSQCQYLCKKYSHNFIFYRNPVYRFKGVDVALKDEPWLQQLLMEKNIIQSPKDISILRVQLLTPSIKVVEQYHVHSDPFSFVLFLNAGYTGGRFVYHAEERKCVHRQRVGEMLFFRGELPHYVSPLRKGQRFTLVAFLKRSAFKA